MLPAQLDAAIAAVCPISGVSLGTEADKSTWVIHFLGHATDEQRAKAHDVMTAFEYREPAPNDELQEQIDFIRWVVGADSLATPAAFEPAPENHFADLMLADETLDDARERLSQRLRELRHYLIAPEIKVNEDGSVGLTAGEQAELADLERRQTLGRWLEA